MKTIILLRNIVISSLANEELNYMFSCYNQNSLQSPNYTVATAFLLFLCSSQTGILCNCVSDLTILFNSGGWQLSNRIPSGETLLYSTAYSLQGQTEEICEKTITMQKVLSTSFSGSQDKMYPFYLRITIFHLPINIASLTCQLIFFIPPIFPHLSLLIFPENLILQQSCDLSTSQPCL